MRTSMRFALIKVLGLAALVACAVAGAALPGAGRQPSPPQPGTGHPLKIGWASADLTPSRPVLVAGQMHARVSEGVADPITATALAIESGDGADSPRAVLVSCDLAVIPDALLSAVRVRVRARLPGMDPLKVVLNATHTHTAPEVRGDGESVRAAVGVDLPVMAPGDYVAFAAERIASAVAQAWERREPGGIGYGLGHAVVGRNRRMVDSSGQVRTYGATDDPSFSHVEGPEDPSLNVLATWKRDGRLAGLVVNVACPSQVDEGDSRLSADYWCDVRTELRRRFGPGLFVLPQCGAAGDQSPHEVLGKRAEERMRLLQGRSARQEIAVRIADGVAGILPAMEKEVAWGARFDHRVVAIELPARRPSQKELEEARAKAATARERYEALARDLAEHPEKKQAPRWYHDITAAHGAMRRHEAVERRDRAGGGIPVELHAVRLGEVAMATNPFELFLDYGLRIQARSPAIQTFLVQLAGSGTYLPSPRAGGASTPVGPEGGRELAEKTIEMLRGLWSAPGETR